MKSLSKFFTSILPAIVLIFLLAEGLLAQEMRVMSYNIRYKNSIDSINGWEYRKENVAALIRYHRADVVGLQEVQPAQLADLEKMLPEFAWYGIPRVEGPSGEYTAVFYRKNRFSLEGSGTFWMSETPDVKESKSWDAFYPRTASWCKLKDKTTKKTFFFFNTHLDHRGETARQKSAEVIIAQIRRYAGQHAVIVTGDFNAVPESVAYQNMTKEGVLKDALGLSETPHYGPVRTSSGFFVRREPLRAKIDYIFVNDKVRVLQHATITDQQEGRYYSDHLPVIAVVEVKK